MSLSRLTKTASSGALEPTWHEFVEAMAQDSEAARVTVERVVTELPSYRAVPAAELLPHIRRAFGVGLAGLRERRLPAPDEDVTPYEDFGRQRARQGVAVEDMLCGWSIGLEAARAAAYRHAPAGEHREPLLLEAIEIMTAWSNLGMHASAAAHRRVELELAREEQHHLANLVRRVLFGGIGPASRQGHLESYGIDLTASYYAVRVRPDAETDVRAIEEHLGAAESPLRRNGLVALIDGDVVGFVSNLPSNGSLRVPIGVAGPVALEELPGAFRLASRALETGVALGSSGLVDLSGLGLAPAVLADHDVGDGVLARYVTPLERRGRSGIVILDTVERYLGNDCQVEVTATELGVHPNTIRYRVGRFERLTGCSLKHSESLVEAWWALRRRRVS